MKVAVALTRNILVPLGTTASASAIDDVIQRKGNSKRNVVRPGKGIT